LKQLLGARAQRGSPEIPDLFTVIAPIFFISCFYSWVPGKSLCSLHEARKTL
jgi:hypothetical protein